MAEAVVSVNMTKNKSAEAVPCWPIGYTYHRFPYGEPIRLPHYHAIEVMKRFRSVVPMMPSEFKKRFGKKPQIFIGRSQGIGDILMLTPSLRELAAEGWEITLAVMPQFLPLLEHNPSIAHAVGCGPNEFPPTKIASKMDLNMQVERARKGDLRMPRAQLFEKLCSVKVPRDKKHPVLILDKEDQAEAKQLLGDKEWIGIAVRTSTTIRNYPVELVAKLARELAKRGDNVVLLHHETDAKTDCRPRHKNILNLQGKTTVGEMCAIIQRCKAFVSADSGPMHVGLTLKTPTVCLEGPMPPEIYLSSYTESPKLVLQKDLPCLGCGHKGFYGQCGRALKGKPLYECMRFPPSKVIKAIDDLVPKKEPAVA